MGGGVSNPPSSHSGGGFDILGSGSSSKPIYGSGSSSYSVTFKIGYKTEMGQSVAIVGNIDPLGNWKQFKGLMKWTEGHIWVL